MRRPLWWRTTHRRYREVCCREMAKRRPPVLLTEGSLPLGTERSNKQSDLLYEALSVALLFIYGITNGSGKACLLNTCLFSHSLDRIGHHSCLGVFVGVEEGRKKVSPGLKGSHWKWYSQACLWICDIFPQQKSQPTFLESFPVILQNQQVHQHPCKEWLGVFTLSFYPWR